DRYRDRCGIRLRLGRRQGAPGRARGRRGRPRDRRGDGPPPRAGEPTVGRRPRTGQAENGSEELSERTRRGLELSLADAAGDDPAFERALEEAVTALQEAGATVAT